MSASRSTLLPFLYPILFRPSQVTSTGSRLYRRDRLERKACPRPAACFHTSIPRARYGTANEPPPHLKSETNEAASERDTNPETATKLTDARKPDDTAESQVQPKSPAPPDEPTKETPEATEVVEEEEHEGEHVPQTTPSAAESSSATASEPMEDMPTKPPPPPPSKPEAQPLETVLHMPSPSDSTNKAPHIKTPPYVHHFDTYGLVKHLEGSGFKQDQSITIMKGVRALLTKNMGMANEGLVSKSNVENESYLFRAAVSELRTEIQNNRKAEMEKMRTERTQLQHEVDILNQLFSQQSGQIKDELKGLFDDRRMSVRMEQKAMENRIQELNYKITVSLNSDARSEVEGLRWLLTRRAATALAISAVMILATLRYSTYMTQTQEKERKEMQQRMAEESGHNNSSSNSGGNSTIVREVPVRSMDEVKGDGLIVSESGGKGYVSLG